MVKATPPISVDRMTLGVGLLRRHKAMRKWRITDVLLCVALFAANVGVYYQQPFERQFWIDDMTISHPFATRERVNNTELLIYSLVVPAAAILAFTLIVADPRHKFYVLYISLLGLVLSFLTTMLATGLLKNWIGRCRPDFLSRCQPRSGLQDHVMYDISVCTTDDRETLIDGFRTTPSGHSSESFAGLGYLFLWLSGQLLAENPLVGSWRKIVAFVPLMAAGGIALTRTMDYRHHFVDITLGGLLGMYIAWWAYRRHFPPLAAHSSFKPLLDDSTVDVDLHELALPETADEELGPLSR